MRRSAAIIAFALVSLPLAGCATSALNMAPDRPDAPWNPATGPDGEIAAGEPGSPDQPNNAATYFLPTATWQESPRQPPILSDAAPILFPN